MQVNEDMHSSWTTLYSFIRRNSLLASVLLIDVCSWLLFFHYLELSDGDCVEEYIKNNWHFTVFACESADMAGITLTLLTLAAIFFLALTYFLFELLRAFSILSTRIERLAALGRCLVATAALHLIASLVIFVL